MFPMFFCIPLPLTLVIECCNCVTESLPNFPSRLLEWLEGFNKNTRYIWWLFIEFKNYTVLKKSKMKYKISINFLCLIFLHAQSQNLLDTCTWMSLRSFRSLHIFLLFFWNDFFPAPLLSSAIPFLPSSPLFSRLCSSVPSEKPFLTVPHLTLD